MVLLCPLIALQHFSFSQFTSLQKEIEDRQGEIEKLKTEQQKLHGVIRSLEKDIQGLKKEILERDETIQDKVSQLGI